MHFLIGMHKNSLPTQFYKKMWYIKLSKHCDVFYVCQTNRLFRTRVKVMNIPIILNTTQYLIITVYRLLNHEFDWEMVEILKSNLEDDEEIIAGNDIH